MQLLFWALRVYLTKLGITLTLRWSGLQHTPNLCSPESPTRVKKLLGDLSPGIGSRYREKTLRRQAGPIAVAALETPSDMAYKAVSGFGHVSPRNGQLYRPPRARLIR